MNREFRRHGSVLLAAGAGVMLGISAIPAFVLGVFAGPMTREFGWSLGQFQTGTLVFTAGILLCSAWIGGLCDRHGARAVAVYGMPLMALGIAGLALTRPPVWSWYLLMGLAAVLGSGTLPIVWTRMVNALFVQNRGLALGLVLSGSGLFALFGAPLAQWLIESLGWRSAWLGLALLPLLVGWPLVAAAFRGDDRSLRASATQPAATAPAGMHHAAALRSYRFWVMGAGFGLVTTGVGGLNANFVPLLGTRGFAPGDAAQLFGVLGLAIATGRLAIGFVIDRVWAPGVAGVVLGLPAISALLLMGADVSRTDALIAVALLGCAQGAEYDFLAYMTARYFGMAHYGRIYGRIVIPIIIATAVGAVGVGYAKDLPGSFDAVLPWIAVLFVSGGLAMLTLGRYPRAFVAAAMLADAPT